MPSINQSYFFQNLTVADLYSVSIIALNNIGASIVQENAREQDKKEIHTRIPSMWGWGGMDMIVVLEKKGNGTSLTLSGYIAQLGVSPLTKKIDLFLENLQGTLKQQYNYTFEYKKLTRFMPSYKLKLKPRDKKVLLAVVFTTLVSSLPWLFRTLDNTALFILLCSVALTLTGVGYKLIRSSAQDKGGSEE